MLNIRNKINIKNKEKQDSLYWIKWEYNTTLERIKKADSLMEKLVGKFFENKKWVEEYYNICRILSRLMQEYKDITNLDLTEIEVKEGFKIIDYYKLEQEEQQKKFEEKYNQEKLKECI